MYVPILPTKAGELGGLSDLDPGVPMGQPLTGHSGNVHGVAVASFQDQAAIVSGGADASVRVWKTSAL